MKRLSLAGGLFGLTVTLFFMALLNNWTTVLFISFCGSYPAFGFLCVALANAPISIHIGDGATNAEQPTQKQPKRVKRLGDQQPIG